LGEELPGRKIRFVRRDVHDGIVGARVRGAKEAAFPIILFLDSHAEVCDNWLEPLVARIHEDRTRVVVPNIRGINIDDLTLIKGDSCTVRVFRQKSTLEGAIGIHASVPLAALPCV
jgi:polypeptide N-acetylgalactosaminyltransferase